ncbi:hypothetical protein DCCM_2596 [Desulfocucumis palustris]|uniref:Uncharacterized protein n=1 Tax=Desulfocucumis palustris TaxID=1898651 RepID=A0A2L2XBX7_9FIRM|nr:hypothetical protein DCCM_2596 [Desulfocucumis palustris]
MQSILLNFIMKVVFIIASKGLDRVVFDGSFWIFSELLFFNFYFMCFAEHFY